MNKISKISLVLAVGAVALSQSAKAVTIHGSISFNGSVTPYVSNNGSGPAATDYTTAHSLVFGQSFVSAGADGSFAGVAQNTVVNMFSPLVINPATVPAQPASGPLWSVDGFTFTLTTLAQDPFVASNTLTLRGNGIMDDGNPLDENGGTWVATFTSGTSTFSWNSSSTANAPDTGMSLFLLGLGLSALGAFAYRNKQVRVS